MADTKQSCPINFSPIIKVVGSSCNLRCKYCFYEGRRDSIPQIMPVDTAKVIIDKTFDYYKQRKAENHLGLSWHGGEPLLAGIDFYEEILQYQKEKYKGKIRNSIQTNGVLLNHNFIKIFKKYNVQIGISLDGPKKVHDKQRVYGNHCGTFKEIMQNIALLKINGIPFSTISVVTKNTINCEPQEFLHFFHDLKTVETSFNYSIIPKSNNYYKNLHISYKIYAQFMLEIFKSWLEINDPSFRIRPLYIYILASQLRTTNSCSHSNGCLSFLSIDTDGTVYHCSNFQNEGLSLGNIKNQEINDIIKSPKFKTFTSYHSTFISKCNDCKWYRFCHGGCIDEKETDVVFAKGSEICSAKKILFEEITNITNRIIKSC